MQKKQTGDGTTKKPSGFKKLIRFFLIMALVCIVGLTILFVLGLLSEEDPVNDPVPPYNKIKSATEENNTVKVTTGDIVINLIVVTSEEKDSFLADEGNGAYVQGVTKDGKTFEGRGDTVFVESSGTIVSAKPEGGKKKSDPGKTAGIASAVTTAAGYDKNKKDWNTGSSVHFIEKANCVLYYPSQLTLQSEKNGVITFTDARSNAVLTVTLSKNTYASMDEVEAFLEMDEAGDVLASGTDWYTTLLLESDKKTDCFSYVGLGNDYTVNCTLRYEDKYAFVFNELRGLIRCRFVEEGKWVSNAKVDTTGTIVSVLNKNGTAYDPVIKQTSYYFEDLGCVAFYPDVFTKAYRDDLGIESFTDPHTGAYILVSRETTDLSTQAQLQATLEAFETELVGSHGCKGKILGDDFGMMIYAAVKDGFLYAMTMTYPSETAGIYEEAYAFFALALEGEAVSSSEMQDIYYPTYSCNITIPLQFREIEADGDVHIFEDRFTGLTLRLTFSEETDASAIDNVYEAFHVSAEDKDVITGETYVKWHNRDGAFVGAIGGKYMCLLEISNTNAFSVYEDSWERFSINFADGAEAYTEVDEIRAEVEEVLEAQMLSESETTAESDTTKATEAETTKAAETKEGHVIVPEERKEEYDTLLKANDGLYAELPFDSIEIAEVNTVVVGDLSAVKHCITDESAWEDEILAVYRVLLEDFDPVLYDSSDASIGVYMVGKADGQYPDVELFFYCDCQWFDVMVWLKDADSTPARGVMDYDRDVLTRAWEDMDDLDGFRDFSNSLTYNMYALNSWYDCSDLYMRTVIDPFDVDVVRDYDYDWDTVGEEWYYGLFVETGTYVGTTFVRDHIYFGTGVGDLYEVLDGEVVFIGG